MAVPLNTICKVLLIVEREDFITKSFLGSCYFSISSEEDSLFFIVTEVCYLYILQTVITRDYTVEE